MSPPHCNVLVFLVVLFTWQGVLGNSPSLGSWYTTDGRLDFKGAYAEDWIPMSQSEALGYYTAKEICDIAGCSGDSGTNTTFRL